MTGKSGTTESRAAEMTIELRPPLLVCRFAAPHRTLSWAVLGGGFRECRSVAWVQVRDADLGLRCDPGEWAARVLAGRGLQDTVALMTSRRLDRYVVTGRKEGAFSVNVVATVGLSNALRIGDPPGLDARAGTINILARLSQALTPEAFVEAVSIVAEARTAAMLESGRWSRLSGRPATGTGTDCIVVAAPLAGEPLPFAGKHTLAGSLLGSTAEEAVKQGVQQWIHDTGR